MATNTGTYDISSLLRVTFQTAEEFGLDKVNDALERDRAAWNALVVEMLSDMAELTTDRQRAYGTSVAGEMLEVDEYGLAPTQKAKPGVTVGFPLRLFQYNIGWTAKYLQVATPADLATQQLAAEKAHWREILRQIKKAIYLSANYTYRDHLIDNVELAVKRFVNGDGAGIPDGPNGETFDGAAHTHYDAFNGWSASELTEAINSVIEHGHGGDVRVAINKADETPVRALPGFVAYVDPRIVIQTTEAPAQRLDISRLDNRPIGIFGGGEVWVKSWAIDNYPFIWDADDPNKPLAYRQRTQESLQGLRIAFENADYPLYAKDMESEFGVGVLTRTNGLVHYTGGSTYTDPTIA